MCVTELGIVAEVKPVQPLNALFPIIVTELGMVTEVKLVQPENASVIAFTLLPILSVLRLVQYINTQSSKSQFSALKLTSTKFVHLENAQRPILVTELGIVTEVKFVHSENAQSHITVTELGIVTEVKLVHLENASLPITVTELGIVTEVKLLQCENA